MPSVGFEPVTPSKRSAADPRLKPRCHCKRFSFWRNGPHWAMASSFMRFLDHKQRHTTVGGTPLDGRSALLRDLYLTAHNTQNRQTSMLLVGFEPTITAGKRSQAYALDRAVSGTRSDQLRQTYLLKLMKYQKKKTPMFNIHYCRGIRQSL